LYGAVLTFPANYPYPTQRAVDVMFSGGKKNIGRPRSLARIGAEKVSSITERRAKYSFKLPFLVFSAT